jgi:hypothetical protein
MYLGFLLLLGRYRKEPKATVSIVMSVCLSVRPYGTQTQNMKYLLVSHDNNGYSEDDACGQWRSYGARAGGAAVAGTQKTAFCAKQIE